MISTAGTEYYSLKNFCDYDINFKTVNKENIKQVEKLSVKNNQSDFIETTKQCLYEAGIGSYGFSWKPTAIYDDDEIIGFTMYGKNKLGQIWLDRFMIDEDYQSEGYGHIVLPILIDRLLNEYDTDELYLSVNENNDVAINLYENNGFEFTGEMDVNGKDPIMMLKI